MNAELVKNEIQNLINELHTQIGGRAARKQYAPAKHQIAKLTELGILDLMPAGFGHSDAGAVINAAIDGPKQVGGFVDGEGDVTMSDGSQLWKLLKFQCPEGPAKDKQFTVHYFENPGSEITQIAYAENGIVVDSQAVIFGGQLRDYGEIWDGSIIGKEIKNLKGYRRVATYKSRAHWLDELYQ